jgi:hypothetical protein
VILEAEPNQRLVDLVSTEEKGQRCEEQLIVPATEVTEGIDADGGYNNTTNQIAFRGEAHK